MTKYSVKKPLTIFAAVIVVLVLGIISYTRMTPDLFPNMDFPYVVVVTSYPGATPEEVEVTVTKPIEQSLATLDHIKSIESTSSSNYSMVVLEFTNDINMDTVSVDILQQIDLVSGAWDDAVGSPYILKINPSMIPVEIAAVNMEGMDEAELSAFASDVLLPELEGVEGVASITTSGLLEKTIEISLSDEKIQEMNEAVAFAVNRQLEDSKAELDEAQEQIDSGKAEVESGKEQLAASQSQTFDELSQASQAIDEAVAQSAAYNAQLSGLNASKSALETERSIYTENMGALEDGISQSEAALSEITAMRDAIAALLSAGLPDGTPLSAIIPDADLLAQLSAQGCETVGDLRTLDSTLAEQESTVSAQKEALESQKASFDTRIAQIDVELANLETEIAAAQAIADQVNETVSEAKSNYAAVESGKLVAAAGFGSGSAELASAQTALENAQADLNAAAEQYDAALEEALKSTDLNGLITRDTIASILTAQNFSMPAGYTYGEDGTAYLVSVGDEIRSADELENLMLFDLGIEGLDPIYLGDVAEIRVTDNADDIYAMINGNRGLALSFTKQSTYSTAGVSDNIDDKFAELSAQYEGLTFTPLMDQGDYIYIIADSIIESLLWGALFAVLVLFFFLRDPRPTFITLCSIPISLMFAVVLMYFSGVTINMMSLSGLSISVGMLVDNSIVVIENTYRLRALGESPVKAAVSGARQVGGAIAASTLTTVCVFLPIVFIDGLTRQLFTDLALTVTYALLASLIIAMTLVPAMSGMILKKIRAPKQKTFGKLLSGYRRALSWALSHKAVVLLLALALLISSAALSLSKGMIFMPETSSSQIDVSIEMPEDASFSEKTEIADRVMDRLLEIDEIETVGAIMSDEGSGILTLMGNGDTLSMYVILDRAAGSSSAAICRQIEADCADIGCPVTADDGSSMTSYSEMFGGSGISINVYGNDLDSLQEGARLVADCLSSVNGVQTVNDGLDDTDEELRFIIDKSAAMKHGLTVAQVYMEISNALTYEQSATAITEDGEETAVVIVDHAKEDLTPEFIENYRFTVTDSKGEETEVALKDIATLEKAQSLQSINRSEQRRYITVTAELEEGYNVTLTTGTALKALDGVTLPVGVTYESDGSNEAIMDAMSDLVLMLAVGILLIYLIMAAQFQSLKSPFIVMFTLPLAFTGGFLALLVCGMEFSIISMVGFVMLCGIIVNNGIVLVDYINLLRQGGMERRQAIGEACATRVRPVLMTSATTILGLLVMALGIGEGTEMMQPIAVVCIGGLLYATLMTLFVVPVIYDAINKKELRVVSEEDLELSEK